MVVVQHDADEEVKQTHCHLGIWGSTRKIDALKEVFVKTYGKLSGNKDWSWEHKSIKHVADFRSDFIEPGNADEESTFRYLTYCLKGDITTLRFKKNISDDLIRAAVDAWKAPKRGTNDATVVYIDRRPKVAKTPYQQEVIAYAAAEWAKHKKETEFPDKDKLIEYVCDGMRQQSKGINVYLVRELAYAVLYDDPEYRHCVLSKIKKIF